MSNLTPTSCLRGCVVLCCLALNLFFSIGNLAFAQEYRKRELQLDREPLPVFDEVSLRQKMRADGLADPVIDKLVAQHRSWYAEGRKVAWTHGAAKITHPSTQAACNGLGVENGWGAWSGLDGSNNNANQLNYQIAWNPATTPPTSTLIGLSTGAGIDPNTPGPNPGDPALPVVCPGFGTTSIVLNPNCLDGYLCEQLTYPLTVTSTDTNFVYAYALVIQDGNNSGGPPHNADNQPYVEFSILDASGNPIPCSYQRYVGGNNAPGFYDVNGQGCADIGDLYKTWSLVGVNLAGYVGQTLNVVITNVDCALGGHFVKSYWDFLCGTTTLTAGCVGNQSTICGPEDPNIAYNYQWLVNNTPVPGATQQCVTLTPAQGDTIKVLVTTADGCGFVMAYTPELNTPAFTYSGICNPINFAGTTTSNGTSVPTGWNWSFPGGTPASASTQNASVTYPGPGNYTATLTVSYSSGCTSVSNQSVSITGSGVTAAFLTDSVCDGLPVVMTDQSTAAASDPIVTRNWTFIGGNPATASGNNPSVLYPPGSHTAQLTVVTAAGCSSSVSRPVYVYRKPEAAFTAPGIGCTPFCHTFIDNSNSPDGAISQRLWLFQNGTPSNSNQPNPRICWSTPGSHAVRLTVESQYGCKDTVDVPTAVQTIPAPTASISGNARVCVNEAPPLITLNGGNSTGPYTFSYTVNGSPNQVVSGLNGTATIQAATNQVGTFNYVVTGVVSSSQPACSSQVNQQVQVIVEETPEADFLAVPKDCPSSATIDFRNQTVNGYSYLWDFGDGQFSTETNPEHYFYNGDEYTVSLLAISRIGCRDSLEKTIDVEQDFRLWTPNAFTPNGDNKNERFYPVWISASKIRFSIFNRWGTPVFISEELGKGWDGTLNGADVPEGVYVFRVEATDLCEKQKTFTGKFFLVR
ncbi:MAG: PKD domain-containing protein [Bacteroidota bacterium]